MGQWSAQAQNDLVLRSDKPDISHERPTQHDDACLIPTRTFRQILAEAFRILRPGGSVSIMEMDPSAPGYIKLRNNPVNEAEFMHAVAENTAFDMIGLASVLLARWSRRRRMAREGRKDASDDR